MEIGLIGTVCWHRCNALNGMTAVMIFSRRAGALSVLLTHCVGGSEYDEIRAMVLLLMVDTVCGTYLVIMVTRKTRSVKGKCHGIAVLVLMISISPVDVQISDVCTTSATNAGHFGHAAHFMTLILFVPKKWCREK